MSARPRLCLALWAAAAPAGAETFEIAPGDDWCGVLNAASGGDEILLLPGEHAGPCSIDASGAAGSPLALLGAKVGDPPRMVYDGDSSNVIDVWGEHLVIAGLAFGPTAYAVDAIKIRQGGDVTIEACVFEQVGGISVSSNSADTYDITVRASRFTDLQATGLYFGCHDGAGACASTNVLVEGNLFDGVDSVDGVGYALEIKVDSWGVVRDNVINDTKGPAIEIYGAYSEDAPATVVEGNFAVRSREAGTIEVGGGPAVVQSNVVVGGAAAAILVYDYGGRGLVRGVTVAGNTAIGEGAPAIDASGEYVLANNAAAGAFPAGGSANVDCSDLAACFADAGTWDFGPRGPLLDAAAGGEYALDVDFCGRARADPADVGALEEAEGPGALAVDFKSTFDCGAGAESEAEAEGEGEAEAEAEAESEAESEADSPGGCGCALGAR